MLLYNWKKVYNVSKGDLKSCYLIMEMLTKNITPTNKYDSLYYFSGFDFKGESFLVHPDVLFFNAYKYSLRELGVYFSLASMRPLSNYLATKETTLDTLLLPEDEIILQSIEDTRLLSVDEEGNLHFLYEEVPQEKTEWH